MRRRLYSVLVATEYETDSRKYPPSVCVVAQPSIQRAKKSMYHKKTVRSKRLRKSESKTENKNQRKHKQNPRKANLLIPPFHLHVSHPHASCSQISLARSRSARGEYDPAPSRPPTHTHLRLRPAASSPIPSPAGRHSTHLGRTPPSPGSPRVSIGLARPGMHTPKHTGHTPPREPVSSIIAQQR